MNLSVTPIRKFSKTMTFPGDKSVSHRAVMLGAIAKGKTEIRNFLQAEDCLSTLRAFQEMGIQAAFFKRKEHLVLFGKGLRGLCPPRGPIDLGNSGTSIRLLLGILAGQNFSATLIGDASLSRRPMTRVILPLERMGAAITGRGEQNFPPLSVQGGALQAIRYRTPMPSAQVKSAILFAGLYAEGRTTVTEPFKTRDHTERMLQQFGKVLLLRGRTVSLRGGEELEGSRVLVPGDISSAANFIVLAAALEGSRLVVKEVGLNPTRIGFIRVLQRMGAQITLTSKRGTFSDLAPKCPRGQVGTRSENVPTGEPVGEIEVRGSRLHGTTVVPSEIPALIDELPILMVAAAIAKGKTVFRNATELRVKETDRIDSMVKNLRKMGVSIWNEKDDVFVEGGRPLHGKLVESFKDHRTAMSLAIAGCLAFRGKTVVRDVACIQTSFPGFIKLIDTLSC